MRARSVVGRSSVLLPLLRRIVAKFSNWRRVRRAERELLGLDDRYLKDIGIARSADSKRGPRSTSTLFRAQAAYNGETHGKSSSAPCMKRSSAELAVTTGRLCGENGTEFDRPLIDPAALRVQAPWPQSATPWEYRHTCYSHRSISGNYLTTNNER